MRLEITLEAIHVGKSTPSETPSEADLTGKSAPTEKMKIERSVRMETVGDLQMQTIRRPRTQIKGS